MVKTRMSIDDIHAMVGSIRKNVLNMRITNIYDLASANDGGKTKTYIFKLHQPPFPKVFLLLESGIRFHTSKYARDASSSSSKSSLPSQFTMKLRKHLRGKRLVALQQLQGDRVVDLTFGTDELQCHLILELYASGNIILTDDKYTILSLLRTHKFDENVKVAVKQVYPIQVLENKPSSFASTSDLLVFVKKNLQETTTRKKQQTFKQLLLIKESPFGGLGPVIVEHCIVRAGMLPSTKFKSAAEFEALGPTILTKLLEELQQGSELLRKLQEEQTTIITDEAAKETANSTEKHGFIVLKEQANASDPETFEEFTPFLYAQHATKPVKSFATFDEAVDEYFSHFETQQAALQRHQAQAAAATKLEKLRRNQKQQLDQLRQQQEKSSKHAQLIETNQQEVENVLLVVRSALASGMDWKSLEELVKYEQKNGNPVASLIHELDLANNRVAILLCDEDDDQQDEEDAAAHVIWIDLSLSALANAREKYSQKKKATEKAKKAHEATEKAIELAEKNTKQTMQKQQMKRNTIYQRRKVLWFEKFHWFLSSEQYLVIAGKDAHQNELLVKRYLRKGDVYVHADLHGAATCIVRNRVSSQPIPIATLEQAGCMSVCRSNAWTSQVIAGAYWVHADQVSKTAPSGEYLTTGSFMVRGKKNFINPSRLEMGLAILFRLDDSSIANHVKDNEDEETVVKESDEETVKEDVETVKEDEHDQADDQVENDDQPGQVQEPDVVDEPADEYEQNDDQKEEKKDDAEQEEDDSTASSANKNGKKRLSAKQRRDLKKGKAITLNEDEREAPEPKRKGKGKGKDPTPPPAPQPAPKQSLRGKKGKLKKMKKKYADQDEEDRRLRMELLGHTVETEQKENDEEEDQEPADDDDKPVEEKESTPAVDEAYIRAQREKKEKFLEQEEEEADGADFLDAFTGAPLPNDLVMFAMPVCAPYGALLKYKYKVKLTPGSQKKGKAAKQAMDHFLASNLKEEKTAKRPPKDDKEKEDEEPDVDPLVVQRELMKCIPENELVNCMVGPVKISAPGLHATDKKGKKVLP